MASHPCAIHEKAIVEAFPNLFLGTLCDEENYPEKPSRQRKWTDTLFPLVAERLGLLLKCLLPRREIKGSLALDDHEEIAQGWLAMCTEQVRAPSMTSKPKARYVSLSRAAHHPG